MNVAFLRKDPPETPPDIRVSGYFYLVDFGDEVTPRYHPVGINGSCTCALGKKCPSVGYVREYLDNGGTRAARPRSPGFYPVPPARCPICGADVVADPKLGSRKRGIGWRCTEGGATHYWKRQGQLLAQAFEAKRNNVEMSPAF